ncbi:hypothetical protein ACR6HW_09340 [Fusibacter sp. JL298sf-3]
MAKILSLCLTTQLMSENYEGNNYKTVLFRLKDVEKDAFVDYQRTNDFDDGYQEDTGYKYPYTDYRNHVINELKIWEWDPFDKIWAVKTNRVFYELIRDYSLDHLDRMGKIKALKDGVFIEKYDYKPCLLVLEETEEEYFVMYADSSILKKKGSIHKLDQSVTHLNGYYLLKNDFFSTDNVKVLDENGVRFPGRMVYKFLSLYEPDDRIDVLTFEEKLGLFVQSQVKALSLSKAERRNTKHWLDMVLSEPLDIEKFFVENGWSIENIEEAIESIKKQIDEVFVDENLRMSICQGLIRNSNSIVTHLKHKIEEDYLTHHKKEVDKRNRGLAIIDEEINKRQNKKNAIDAQITDMETKLENLIERTETLNEIDSKLSDKVREKISKANSDVVEFLSQYAMVSNQPKEHSIMNGARSISTSAGKLDAEESYSIDSTTEMVDVLKSNLDSIGIDKELSYSLSSYILCSIKQGMSLSFVGKYSKLLFDCVSKSLAGRLGTLLYINSVDTSKDELMESVIETDEIFVGIADLLQKNSNLAMEILSDQLNKQIVFITLLPESLSLMDDSIFNFVNFVYTDWIFDNPNVDLECIEASVFANLNSIDIEEDRRTMKKVKDTLNSHKQQLFKSKLHFLQKSKLITLLNQLNNEDSLFAWIFFELLPSMKQNGHDYDESISNLDLSDKHRRFLEENIW